MGMSDTRSRGYLAALMDTIFDECRALRNAGQQEYAHDDANAYANFERLALRMGLSREQVLMVYLEKHIDGIHSYIQGHKSQRESVVGRINDAIVYLCILRGMVENSGAAPKKILDERAAEQAELVRDAEEAPQLRAALARAEASTARLTYLENLIQDLPHEDQCPCSGYIVKPPKCLCWKSDAQKVEQEDPTP